MPNKTAHETNQQVLHEIERAIGDIQFGSVEITLHEGRVTQIERREKVRLTTEHKPVRLDLYGRTAAKKS
ncbi:MAG TPA: YezD family protein [Gallionella sp.]|nr:YezD family protein [Gallionella sp.]